MDVNVLVCGLSDDRIHPVSRTCDGYRYSVLSGGQYAHRSQIVCDFCPGVRNSVTLRLLHDRTRENMGLVRWERRICATTQLLPPQQV